MNPPVLETLQPYRAAKSPSIHVSHRISTCFSTSGILRSGDLEGISSAQQYGLPLYRPKFEGAHQRTFLKARKSGRQKINKRTCFGGPCFEGTLQESCYRLSLNESLVAEANFSGNLLMSAAIERIQKSRLAKALLNQPLPYFQCRTRTRVAKKRPASHTNALGSLFIARNPEKRKPQSKFSWECLRRWFRSGDRLRLSEAKGTVEHAMHGEREVGIIQVLGRGYRPFE